MIEVTATDLEKAKIVLNTIVSMFSQYTSNGTENDTSFLLVFITDINCVQIYIIKDFIFVIDSVVDTKFCAKM